MTAENTNFARGKINDASDTIADVMYDELLHIALNDERAYRVIEKLRNCLETLSSLDSFIVAWGKQNGNA